MCSFCEHARAPSLSACASRKVLGADGSNSADPISLQLLQQVVPDWTVRGFARAMRAFLGLCSDSMVATNTVVGTSVIPSSRRPFTKRNASKPKQNRGTEEHPTPYEAAASPAKGGTRKYQRQGAVERRSAWMKSCPVLLTAQGVNKTGQQRWLRRIDRKGRVRASVCGHGAQPSAHSKAAWCAPPRRRRHGTTRCTGVKHARTRLRLTPAPGAPCEACVRRRRGATFSLWLGDDYVKSGEPGSPRRLRGNIACYYVKTATYSDAHTRKTHARASAKTRTGKEHQCPKLLITTASPVCSSF